MKLPQQLDGYGKLLWTWMIWGYAHFRKKHSNNLISLWWRGKSSSPTPDLKAQELVPTLEALQRHKHGVGSEPKDGESLWLCNIAIWQITMFYLIRKSLPLIMNYMNYHKSSITGPYFLFCYAMFSTTRRSMGGSVTCDFSNGLFKIFWRIARFDDQISILG